MNAGHTAEEALQELLKNDAKREFRQVAMIDRHGHLATHTGNRCFPEAGCYVGDAFCTQANMMLRNTVWQVMAKAYQETSGDFANRLLTALDAAQAEGGDIRGQQTAALLVVDAELNPIPLIDLRVDYHPQPLQKLKQLLKLHRAYSAEYDIPYWVEDGQMQQATTALSLLQDSGEPYLQYLGALHLASRLNKWDEAIHILQNLVNEKPIWYEYLKREASVNNFGYPDLGNRLLASLKEPQT